MITKVEYPDEYSFIGNPMIVAIYGDKVEEVIVSVHVDRVKIIDLTTLLFGNYNTFYSDIDISQLLAASFKPYTTLPITVDTVPEFEVNYSITVTSKETSQTFVTFNGKAFNGGVNTVNYKQLKAAGTNIFDYRLNNPARQFLFTNRTNSNFIVLRETELEPFIFIQPPGQISLVTPNGIRCIVHQYPSGTLCALNIAMVRKEIYDRFSEFSSFFAVMVDGKNIFNIALIPNPISEESYILKFKNSLGAFERIEVTGTANEKHEFAEEHLWMLKNQYDLFEEQRSRVSSRKHIEVESGYKSRDELAFIFDLIKSDEIYFIDPLDEFKTEHRCFIVPDETTLPKRMVTPNSIKLDIRFVADDTFEAPALSFDESLPLFQNLTREGDPRINRYGLIYDEEKTFHSK